MFRSGAPYCIVFCYSLITPPPFLSTPFYLLLRYRTLQYRIEPSYVFLGVSYCLTLYPKFSLLETSWCWQECKGVGVVFSGGSIMGDDSALSMCSSGFGVRVRYVLFILLLYVVVFFNQNALL